MDISFGGSRLTLNGKAEENSVIGCRGGHFPEGHVARHKPNVGRRNVRDAILEVGVASGVDACT